MAGPPTSVWVEVSTELLAELGDWSEPVQVRITDLRPNGQVEMVLRSTEGPEADLRLALKLLDSHTFPIEDSPCCFDHHGGCQEHGFLSLAPGEKCPTFEAHELLVRHGIREA